MKDGPDIAPLASLIGDPARANMLTALLSGTALTASELAAEAGIGAATASSHLAKLEAGGLILRRAQGRHRYFALAGDGVGRALEALLGLAAQTGGLRHRPGPRDERLRQARVCYDHLAGTRGIELYDSLAGRAMLTAGPGGLTLAPAGRGAILDFGIDLAALQARRAPLCRDCLDWSERRSHLGGSLGRALWSRIAALGWARRDEGSRAVRFSPEGARAFAARFPPPPVGAQSRSV